MSDAPELRGILSLKHAGTGDVVIACADGPPIVLRHGQAARVWAWRGRLWRRRPSALRTRPISVRWWLRRGHTMPPLFADHPLV